MEEETQNSTPKADSIELENHQDCSLMKVESPLRSDSDPDSGLQRIRISDPESNAPRSLVPEVGETPKSEEECYMNKRGLQELKNQARELQDEVFKSLNQNLELKKRFRLAKSVLRRDVRCLEELVREREEEGWCGSKDALVALKKKLHSLKNQVRVKREESKEGVCSIPFECPLPEDERIQDLVFMEREYMIQNVRREEHQWIEDRDKLARKYEFFVERNKRLEAEASSIRSDLCTEAGTLEVVSVSRFLEVQRRMDACLEKKFKLKNSLLAAEASVRANEAEIERLEAEVGRQEALLAESETRLAAAEEGGGEGGGDDLVEELRVEREATSRTFREALGELLATCGALLGRAEASMEDVRCSKSEESVLMRDELESPLVAEIRRRRDSGDAGFPKLIELHCPLEPPTVESSSSCPPPLEEQQGTEGRTEPVERVDKVEETNYQSSTSLSTVEPVQCEDNVEEANYESSTSLSTIEPVQCKERVEETTNYKSSSTSLSTAEPVECEEKVEEEGNLEPSASPSTIEQEEEKVDRETSLESCLETEKECRDAIRDLLSNNTIVDFDLSTFDALQPLLGEGDHLLKCLEEELLELSSSFAKRKRELRKRHWRLQAVFARLKSEANQLLDARGQLSKESATVRVLSNRLKRMSHQEVDKKSSWRAGAETFGDASSETEDSKALLHVLRSENACVKRLIRAACASIDQDVDKFLQLPAIKIFF